MTARKKTASKKTARKSGGSSPLTRLVKDGNAIEVAERVVKFYEREGWTREQLHQSE